MLPSRRFIGIIALAWLLPASRAETQAADVPVTGTIIVAHGGGPEWDARVDVLARQVQLPGPVEVSFLMGPGAARHRFQDVVASLVRRGATEIVVVPLLVASHSGHYDQVRYLAGVSDQIDSTMLHHLHLSGIERSDSKVPIRVTPAIDGAPEIAPVIADRARALATDPSRQALFLVGHGPNSPEDYAAWMADLRRLADSVKMLTGFRHVMVDLVRDDAPDPVRREAVTRIRELIELQHEATGETVVVVPILISTGRLSREILPADLKGLAISYTAEGLLPHPAMARWVEARVRQSNPIP
jgi:sirohydrochlorin cobaltochelatase